EVAANNHPSNTITPPSTVAKNKQTVPSQSTAVKSSTTPLTNHKQPNQNRALSATQTGETSGNTRENPANTTSGYVMSEHTTSKNKPAVNQLSQDQPSPSTKLVSEQLATVTSSEQDKTKVTKKAQSSAAYSLKGGKNLLKAIAETNQAKATEKLAKAQQEGGLLQHLRLRPNLAPIYYNSMSGGSPIDPKFANNSSECEVTMAYGINVAYVVSDRLQIRSGISRVNMSYNTQDIAFASTVQASSLQGLTSNPNREHLAVFSSERKSF